jgi:hypothetical protein
MVATGIHPPAQGDSGSGIFNAQGITMVGSVNHGKTFIDNGNFGINKPRQAGRAHPHAKVAGSVMEPALALFGQ